MRTNLVFFALLLSSLALEAQRIPALPPLPSPAQQDWQELEYYGFLHFNMNTFTNVEWGEGKESPSLFNPSNLDANQWASIAKASGMKALILTVKHHDGFTLYPSKYTEHNISKSPWKQGKGDVLKELAVACKAHGLKLGVYLSPWDRFHPKYGSPEYNQVYAQMQEEILQQYGEVFEFWYDGANGEGPNGKKQVYDWPLFHETVRKYMPRAIQFSDNGPDIRWVGNERGYAYDETWSPFNKDEIYPGFPNFDAYRNGQREGKHWVPAEVDVSIRPGWYYHPHQDQQVKSPDSLMKIWVASVGRNANLLLNIPVDTRGLFHPADSTALMRFARLRKNNLVNILPANTQWKVSSAHSELYPSMNLYDPNAQSAWAARNNDVQPQISMEFRRPVLANVLSLREPIALGQRVAAFEVELQLANGQTRILQGKTIGNRRMLSFPEAAIKKITLKFKDARAQVLISQIELHRMLNEAGQSLF